MNSLNRLRQRRKTAVSETISTIILIAVTVVLGSVAWVWASSSSVASQNSLGQAAQTNISAINEKFEIVASNFTYTGSTSITAHCVPGDPQSSTLTIWFFNQGIKSTNITTIQLNQVTLPFSQWTPKGPLALPPGLLTKVKISLTSPVTEGCLESVRAVGHYGFYFNYQVVA